MNNILVVNINWLGDAIFSTPVFAALRKAYPQARISCLCVPRVQEVLRFCPDIDDIIIYDEKGKDRWVWYKIALILRLKRSNFCAAFLLHRSMTRALFVFLAGIPKRIGYGKVKGLLTHVVDKNDKDLHRSDYYLRVVEHLGISVDDRHCQLRLNAKDMVSIDEKLKTGGILPSDQLVVFNIGGNWDLKRWPLPLWAQLAKRVESQSKLKIIFSGAPKDKIDAESVIKLSNGSALNLAGCTTLGESLALFRRAKVVVSADSGPLHLANGVGANVIGLFGPTRHQITGPRGSGRNAILFKNIGCNKGPCYHLSCLNNLCMQSIGVEDVWQAIKQFTI